VFHWSIFFAAVCMFTWPSAVSEAGIIAWAIFFPLCAGGFIASFPVIAASQWGLRTLASSMSLISVVMIPGAMASGTLAGLSFDRTGSFSPAIYAAGAILMLSAALFFMVQEKKEPPMEPPAPGLDHDKSAEAAHAVAHDDRAPRTASPSTTDERDLEAGGVVVVGRGAGQAGPDAGEAALATV